MDLTRKSFRLRLNIALYKLVSTCAYHAQMPYCPVLIKVGPELLKMPKSPYKTPYLLQVWDSEANLVEEIEIEGSLSNY